MKMGQIPGKENFKKRSKVRDIIIVEKLPDLFRMVWSISPTRRENRNYIVWTLQTVSHFGFHE